MVQDVIAIDH